MDDMVSAVAAIVEFFVRLLYGIIRGVIYLIGWLLPGTWGTAHFAALRRFGLGLSLLMGSDLLAGSLRATVPMLATPALTPLANGKSWQLCCCSASPCASWIAPQSSRAPTARPRPAPDPAPQHTA